MSLLHFFRWLSHSSFSIYLRHSTWGFAIIETVHLLGLAALGGAILIVDFRLLGIGLRRQPISYVARELSPVLWGSLGVMLISGVLLVMTGPLKYYHSPSFRLKMLLLLLAVGFYFSLHRSVLKSNADTTTSVWRRVAAVVSLILWLGVGLAGRAIGFLGMILV
jgi:hypothetical protein